nr:unnamed protein product [Callosobruchus analis]
MRNYRNESTLENFVTVNKEIARSRKFLKKKAKCYWIQYCRYDQVTYDMLWNLSDKAKTCLTEIYNEAWLRGDVIDAWKNAIVLPILKPGKYPNDAESYRSITLCLAY